MLKVYDTKQRQWEIFLERINLGDEKVKNYIATVSRRRGQPKTLEIEAPDIRDAAAHVREHFPLWGKDPHLSLIHI